jgi:hypothetical protein
MNCAVCGGPLGIDTLAGQEWLKCTRCGTWAGPKALLAGAPAAGAAVPLPAALAPQPLAWGAPGAPPAPPAPSPAPATPHRSPYQDAALVRPPAPPAPTPAEIAAAAAVLARAGVLPAAGAAPAVVPEPPPDVTRVPPAPRQPSPLARKLIFSYQGSQRIKLIIGVAFTLIGFPASLPATWNLPGEIALALSASPGTAKVTRVALNPSVRMNRRTATKIEFAYTVDGERYTESVNTIDGRAIALAKRPNAPLPIEYADIYPGFARIQGCGYSFFGFAAAAFLILPLIGALMWFLAWRSNRREIRAFRRGTPIVARITERAIDTTVKQNGRSPRVVRWAFAVAGVEYHGELSHLDHGLLDRALPGHQLIALYAPKNPAVNTAWLP